jgi:uncharacterized repeat protein (TIGR01451 family)
MKPAIIMSDAVRPVASALAAVALVLLAAIPAQSQQHRAVRLGHPSTRFAPPLTQPEQLRRLLRDEQWRTDIVSILRQAGWKGNVEDLRRAAATAEITEVKLPKGTRMPFMSSRKDGEPVALIDVLWAGNEPIDAYAFEFASNGRRYRCVTPKLCSNFYVVDLGPEKPALELIKTAPAEASLCDPIEVTVVVRNTSSLPLTQVRLTDSLPAGLRSADNLTAVQMDAGTLRPGAGMRFRFNVVATAPGSFVNQVRATAAEGASAEASSTILVRAPALSIDCNVPGEAPVGRPVEVCLTVKNTGVIAEPKTTLTMPVPAGATVATTTDGGRVSDGQLIWELPPLTPQAGKQVCATLAAGPPGLLSLTPTARGSCAPPVQGQCSVRIRGVAGILLEVIDLEDPIEVGHEVTYRIRVLNQGSAPLRAIAMKCTVPEMQEYLSGDGVTAVRAENRVVTMDPLPELAPKAEASWRVAVKASRAGDARFKVELTGDQFIRPIEEYESTTQY